MATSALKLLVVNSDGSITLPSSILPDTGVIAAQKVYAYEVRDDGVIVRPISFVVQQEVKRSDLPPLTPADKPSLAVPGKLKPVVPKPGTKSPTLTVFFDNRPSEAWMAGMFCCPEGEKMHPADSEVAPCCLFAPGTDLSDYHELFGNVEPPGNKGYYSDQTQKYNAKTYSTR